MKLEYFRWKFLFFITVTDGNVIILDGGYESIIRARSFPEPIILWSDSGRIWKLVWRGINRIKVYYKIFNHFALHCVCVLLITLFNVISAFVYAFVSGMQDSNGEKIVEFVQWQMWCTKGNKIFGVNPILLWYLKNKVKNLYSSEIVLQIVFIKIYSCVNNVQITHGNCVSKN